MDICGHMCGVRYSQINPHRSLKEVREFESMMLSQSASAASFIENNRPKNNPEKKIN